MDHTIYPSSAVVRSAPSISGKVPALRPTAESAVVHRRRERPATGEEATDPSSKRHKERRREEDENGAAADEEEQGEEGAAEEVRLTEEQGKALVEMVNGEENVFLTGAAGTGKTLLLRLAVQQLAGEGVHVTAMTGMASILIGGTTLHRWAGVGLGAGSPQQLLAHVESNAETVRRWRSTRVLVVDEVSMLSARLFDTLDFIACAVNRTTKPFGGIRLVLCGDFCQLPPVGSKEYCFMSKRWPAVVTKVINLSQVVRQSEPELIAALNEIRLGRVSEATLALLNARVVAEKAGAGAPGDSIEATKLSARLKDVAAENEAMMALLPSQPRGMLYRALDAGPSFLLEDCAAPAELKLRVGAQVVVVRNIVEGRRVILVNGSRGVVTGFDLTNGRFPIVKFLNGRSLTVQPTKWVVTQSGRDVASRTQLPLALAWCLTIHRSQGMTIDNLRVDLSSCFENGQAFVALSRCSSLAGLTLCHPITAKSIRAHPDVVRFYVEAEEKARFQEGRPLRDQKVFVIGKLEMHSKDDMRLAIEHLGGVLVDQLDQASKVVIGVPPSGVAKHALFDDQLRQVPPTVACWTEAEFVQRYGAQSSTRTLVPPPDPHVIDLLSQ